MAIDANIESTATGRGHSTVSTAAPRSVVLAPELHRVERVSAGLWRDAARRLARDRAAVAGLVVVAVLVIVALLAPAIVPYDPIDQSFRIKLQAPSTEH